MSPEERAREAVKAVRVFGTEHGVQEIVAAIAAAITAAVEEERAAVVDYIHRLGGDGRFGDARDIVNGLHRKGGQG